ncbi:LLM class flavin-dependent oxidoreductase [Fodinicola feengrottensis]|uniref:LLM class flavin-dependent oxidoreductase n=1 Tax=Fodinicola feengrottensis TaxID=435914 RepID=A0ABN2GSV2_9ACTN|nr:LLM class flavin-dependent oxidoreductase [Fodinicola feengrottensis]
MPAFRFGVTQVPIGDGEQWRAAAVRVEELGYSTLLMPDGVFLLSTVPSLAVAATATSTLRVGSFVLASPLRTPRSAAWDAHTLTVLTNGRFDLGLGSGRPSMKDESAILGMPYGSAARRLEQVAETIKHVRELDGEARTPIMIAIGGGPKGTALAAAEADIVHLAIGALTPDDEIAAITGRIREAAGDRADRIEIAMNIWTVNGDLSPRSESFIGTDAKTIRDTQSAAGLWGSTQEMADELERRRKALGVSYFVLNGDSKEQFAPVLEKLSGH